jgi:hypothetical protein
MEADVDADFVVFDARFVGAFLPLLLWLHHQKLHPVPVVEWAWVASGWVLTYGD